MDSVTTAELGLAIECPACGSPVDQVCDPPPDGHALGRLHNMRTRYGKTFAVESAPVPDSMLVDALQALMAEVLDTWDPPKRSDIAALPLTHPDDLARRIIRGRVRSFCLGVADRAAAGESEEQLERRVDRAIRRIVTQDSDGNS